jgi:hypothetical protein
VAVTPNLDRTWRYALTASRLEDRIKDYRRFLPDWPALIQSFERDLEALRASQQLAKTRM